MEKRIIIETAVWGYNYEWHCVKSALDSCIENGNLSIEVFWTSLLGDFTNLKGIVKELRMTYSYDNKCFELLVQEKKGRLLIISDGIAATSDGRGLWKICK